jgi:hypothetical protein
VATYSTSGCDSGDGSGGWGGIDNGGSEAGGSETVEAPATAAEGGISSMLARTTACILEGVTRMVLEDVAEQALAEMSAPPPVSDSAAAGGIVALAGDAKSAALFYSK